MDFNRNIFFDLNELAYLGRNSIVGKTVRIRRPEKVYVGDYSIIDDFTYISSALKIGLFTHIGANGVLIGGGGNIDIGDFVNIAPGCRIVSASNDFSGGGLVGPTIPKQFASESIIEDISIQDHTLLGTGTVVLPGCQLPEGVATAALTLITKKCKLEPWTLYAGIPARPIKVRDRSNILNAAEKCRIEYL